MAVMTPCSSCITGGRNRMIAARRVWRQADRRHAKPPSRCCSSHWWSHHHRRADRPLDPRWRW
jgi:hypothetical protein